MRNKMYILSCAVGLFLIFVAFFAGASINIISNMFENRTAINVQSVILLCGCLLVLPYIIKTIIKVKRIDIIISGIVVALILSLQCAISVFFLITHSGIESSDSYKEMIFVNSKNLYLICTTLRYVFTLLLMPCLGIFALFSAPEERKGRHGKYAQISSAVFFFASAIFLLMMTVTCFKGVQQTLIIIARVTDSSQNIANLIGELRLYNITSISLQQLEHISDLKVGLTSYSDISKFACSFGITILASYIMIVIVAVNWAISVLVDELNK